MTLAKEYVYFNGKVVAFEMPAASCQYSLSQTSQSFGPNSQTGSVTVTTAIGCAWTATSNAGWISIAGGSPGSGTGTVSFSLTANTSTQARTGSLTIAGQTVTIMQSGASSPPPSSGSLYFVPIPPCRAVETRGPTGPLGGPYLAGASTRDFPILSANCGVPAGAQAYSLNIGVIPKQPLIYVKAWPTGQPIPADATVISSSDGRVKSNAAIIQTGTNGSISLYANNDTHVFIDINGYFTSDSSQASFFPVNPCRVADTRGSAGPLGGPYLTGGSTRNFPVLSSACGAPPGATAYVLNVTAVPHGSLTYLNVWAAGQTQPGTSTLNAPTGTSVANAAIAAPGAGGQIAVYASNDTDLVLDIMGWFAPGAGGQAFHTVAPCRAFDTRTAGTGATFSGQMAVSIAGSSCGAPSNAGAYLLNAAVIPAGTLTYLQLWADGVAQPVPAVLNAVDGATTSNLSFTQNKNGSADAYATNSTHLILDMYGYFAP